MFFLSKEKMHSWKKKRLRVARALSKKCCEKGISVAQLMLAMLVFSLFWPFVPENCMAELAPFSPGEVARYQVRWSFVVAGHVDIEVRHNTNIDDQSARHFSLTAKTLPLVDVFHKVRDQLDAYTDVEITRSLGYRKLQTGSSKRDIEILFDWQRQTASYRNFNEKLKPVSIPEGTFDPLSAYFFLRTLDFTDKDDITRPVTDGKKIVVGHARILGRERVTVPAGEFDTYLVEPDMQDVRGVFEKERNARLHVWLTADNRHLLVRAKSKVRVGSFIAELVSLQSQGRE